MRMSYFSYLKRRIKYYIFEKIIYKLFKEEIEELIDEEIDYYTRYGNAL